MPTGQCPRPVKIAARFSRKPASLLFGSADALTFGRGREPWIDHHAADYVPRLANDKLRVEIRVARDHDGLCSGAVRVHGIGARAWPPTRRQVAVGGDCVNLREVSVTVKRLLGEAI